VYCKFIPPAATAANPVPLVIMVHGSGGNATYMYGQPSAPHWPNASNWRGWAEERGFAVVGTQAMNYHWPSSGMVGRGEDGTKTDYAYRNISNNDDFRYFDALIDSLVVTGRIDPRRIYISGWSNGCAFASLYALLRSGSTDGGRLGPQRGSTPAGNMIAAAAVYSCVSPLVGLSGSAVCDTIPPPVSAVPILMLSRICDLSPCDMVAQFIGNLTTTIGSPRSSWILLGCEVRNEFDAYEF
jgi:poly(3-hydroxybutyrate) depolymerase